MNIVLLNTIVIKYYWFNINIIKCYDIILLIRYQHEFFKKWYTKKIGINNIIKKNRQEIKYKD